MKYRISVLKSFRQESEQKLISHQINLFNFKNPYCFLPNICLESISWPVYINNSFSVFEGSQLGFFNFSALSSFYAHPSLFYKATSSLYQVHQYLLKKEIHKIGLYVYVPTPEILLLVNVLRVFICRTIKRIAQHIKWIFKNDTCYKYNQLLFYTGAKY